MAEHITNHINPVTLNENTGRAFPFKDNPEHFVGALNIGGKFYRINVWMNKSINLRPYLRIQAELLEEV